MKLFLHTYRWEICIAGLALMVHLTCFYLFVDTQNGDVLTTVRVDDGFYELTENLLLGNGFTWSAEEQYIPNTMRTPGYVWILAGLISVFGVTGAALVQLVAATTIPVLSMSIARVITNSRDIAIITGVILAIDPTLARLSFQFYTETFFLIFFLSWLLVTLHYFKRLTISLLVVSAFLLGYSILIKASVQYVPLILIPCLIWLHGKIHWRRSLFHSTIFLCIVAVVVAPWFIRNLSVFEAFSLSTQSTFVLYTNFAPAALSVAEKRDFVEYRTEFLTPAEYKGDAITFANQETYKQAAIEIITSHPKETLYLMSRSIYTFFTHDGFRGILVPSGRDPQDYFVFLVTMRLIWIAITLAAFSGGLIYLFTKFKPQTVFIILLVAYFALISTVAAYGTNPRYRLPVDPIILALAGISFKLLFERLSTKFGHYRYKIK